MTIDDYTTDIAKIYAEFNTYDYAGLADRLLHKPEVEHIVPNPDNASKPFEPVPAAETYPDDVRVTLSRVPKASAFDVLASKARKAATPQVNDYLMNWRPYDATSLSALYEDLANVPNSLRELAEHTALADAIEENFTEERPAPFREAPSLSELDWIAKNWLDEAFPLLVDHLQMLSKIEMGVIYYRLYDCELSEKHEKELRDLNFFKWVEGQMFCPVDATCAIIGPTSTVPVGKEESRFYLSLIPRRAGWMTEAKDNGSIVTGRFLSKNRTYAYFKCLSSTYSHRTPYPLFEDQEYTKLVHPLLPYVPYYKVWHNYRSRKQLTISNPYSVAMVVVTTMSDIPVPTGTLTWKAPTRKIIHRPTEIILSPGMPIGAQPLSIQRQKDDVIVKWSLVAHNDTVTLRVAGPEETVLVKAFGTNHQNPHGFRGYAILRGGYLLNPLITDGPAVRAGVLNHMPIQMAAMMDYIGGFTFQKWTQSTSGSRWFVPHWGSACLPTIVSNNRLKEVCPYSHSDEPWSTQLVGSLGAKRLDDLDDSYRKYLWEIDELIEEAPQ